MPQSYFGYSSGPIATAIAAQDGNRRIYMLGFDMGPAQNNHFNNIYADTEFYKPSTALPTFTGNWVKQLIRIMNDYPSTEFVRICGPTTARMAELDRVKNLQHIDTDTFVDRINKLKDL